METPNPIEQILERVDGLEDLSHSRNSSLSRASSKSRHRSLSSASNLVKMIEKALEDFSRSKDYRKTRGRQEVKKGLKSVLKKRPNTRENYETETEDSSSSDDSTSSYYYTPEIQRKGRHAVKVPPNITDSYVPGSNADFKILSAINVQPLKNQEIVAWVKQILELVKARGTISKTDFNCFLFSKLDTATKEMIGHIHLSTIEPQDFVDYLIIRLQQNKTQDSKYYDFVTKARPTADHKGILDWFSYVFKLGRENGVSKKRIWRRFLTHLPLYARHQLQKSLEKYIKKQGHYPGCNIMFVVESLGDEIGEYDEEFAAKNTKLNLLLPETGSESEKSKTKRKIKCFSCAKTGHSYHRCRSTVQKCTLCSGLHKFSACKLYPGESPVSANCAICEIMMGLKLHHEPQVCRLRQEN